MPTDYHLVLKPIAGSPDDVCAICKGNEELRRQHDPDVAFDVFIEGTRRRVCDDCAWRQDGGPVLIHARELFRLKERAALASKESQKPEPNRKWVAALRERNRGSRNYLEGLGW